MPGRASRSRTAAVLTACAVLFLAACGDRTAQEGNEAAANGLDTEMLFESGNDVSAMEAAANELEAEAEPANNAAASALDEGNDAVVGNTDGGDTGGNAAESDISGM